MGVMPGIWVKWACIKLLPLTSTFVHKMGCFSGCHENKEAVRDDVEIMEFTCENSFLISLEYLLVFSWTFEWDVALNF